MDGLIERLFDGRPILEARPEHEWESRVVLNPAADFVPVRERADIPGAWQLDERESGALLLGGGAIAILYRAQGAMRSGEDVAQSSLGLAVLTTGFELVKRWSRPVIRPEGDFHNLGVEDPRITRVGRTWHMYYAGYSGDPRTGRWDDRQIRICHATSDDLVSWSLNGPISGSLNTVPNKNAALLPVPVEGLGFVLLHRPMEGSLAMTICFATATDPSGPWTDQGVLMRGLERPECARSWVGAGGPPLYLEDGLFLMIYHRGSFDHAERREYDLGAALLDFGGRSEGVIIRGRIEPIMRPTGPGERVGDPEVGVDNVLFTCANLARGDELIIPYAGADSRIFAARADIETMIRATREE